MSLPGQMTYIDPYGTYVVTLAFEFLKAALQGGADGSNAELVQDAFMRAEEFARVECAFWKSRETAPGDPK